MAEEEKIFFFLDLEIGCRLEEEGARQGMGTCVEWTYDDCRLEDGVHGAITELANPLLCWLLKRSRWSLGHCYCLWKMRLKSFLELDCSGGGGGGRGGLLLASALTALA